MASIDKDKLMVLTKSTEIELGKSLKWRLNKMGLSETDVGWRVPLLTSYLPRLSPSSGKHLFTCQVSFPDLPTPRRRSGTLEGVSMQSR